MTPSRFFRSVLFVLAGTLPVLFLLSVIGLTTPTAVALQSAPLVDVCFVSLDGSTTTHSGNNGLPVQAAIAAAGAGATLKIAGTCTVGGSSTPVATIDKNLTLVGGYVAGSWGDTPDPVANPTVLDAGDNGRVAIITNNATATLSNLTLRNGDNAVSNFGGAIYTEYETFLSLERVNIEDSRAILGGAVFNEGAVQINNSQLSGNSAVYGGAIYNGDPITITNSSFISNTATTGNGGAIHQDRPLTIYNSTFSYNRADNGNGGAIDATELSFPVIIEYSTFSHNSASNGGGALRGGPNGILANSIIANSSNGGDCSDYLSGIMDGGYNLIEDGSCLDDPTSRSGDPALGPLADNGGATWTHAPGATSIARNVIPYGTNGCGTTTLTDQRGEMRSLSVPCDIGAYEMVADTTCYVEATGDSATDFGSKDAAAVQAAVSNATSGDTLKVAGICAGVQETGGVTQTVYINKDLTLRGGYTTTNWTTSNPATTPTILDAQSSGRVVYIPDGNHTVTLDGLTIQHGATAGDGGGIWTRDNLTVRNSVIQDNYAGDDAGGIYFGSYSVGYVENSVIANNQLPTTSGSYLGGGLFSQLSTITIANSAIYSNTGRTGGGISSLQDIMTIENSTIHNNVVTGQAGGIYNQFGTIYLINSTVSQNHAPNGAGILSFGAGDFTATLVLSYTTVVGNTGNHGIRTLDNGGPAQSQLFSTIIANNAGPDCITIGTNAVVDATAGYNLDSDGSCVTDGVDNNITVDPLLLPLADNGGNTATHALQPGSPAQNAIPSNVNGCGSTILTDQRGWPRPDATHCDIGAVEMDNLSPVATDGVYTTFLNTPLLANLLTEDTGFGLDSDPDGGAITASLQRLPENGTVALNSDGAFTYKPNTAFSGADRFSYVAHNPQGNLVGFWGFEDNKSPTADASGQGHDAVLVNNPTFVTTVPSIISPTSALALDFNGTNTYATANAIPAALDSGAYSMGGWMYARDAVSQVEVMMGFNTSSGGNLILLMYDGDTQRMQFVDIGNVTINSTVTVPQNSWVHVLVTVDPDRTATLYINGQVAGTAQFTRDIPANARFSIGQEWDNSNASNIFDGMLDDVRVYNRALTADEVAVLMAGGTDTAVIDLTIAPESELATDDQFSTAINTPLVVAAPGILANDAAGDYAFTLTQLTSPTQGALALETDGAFVYTPTTDFTGTDSFIYETALVNETLFAYWPFDDGANPTFDASQQGHPATLVNAPTFVATPPITIGTGSALAFNGTNQYLTASGIDLANQSFSIAFWAKRDQPGISDFPISQGTLAQNQGLHIGFNNTNQFMCAFWGDELLTPPGYTDTGWHHWACTYDADSNLRTIYLDGQAVISDTATADFQGSGTFLIGRRFDGYYFDGLLDDVIVSKQVLTAAELQALLSGGQPAAVDTAVVTLNIHPTTVDLSDSCGTGTDLVAAMAIPFTTLIYLAPNCTYTLTVPYAADPDGYGPVGLPSITNTLIISGNGATIVRDETADPFRLFYVTENGRLTLQNLTLANGYAAGNYIQGNGGGIYSRGLLTLTHSLLTHNDADESGGGLYAAGGGSGPGMTAGNGRTFISHSDIISNTGNYSGGGLYAAHPITISHSRINQNVTDDYGGGIALSNSPQALIEHSDIISNSNTGSEGGGLIIEGSQVTIRASRMISNVALDSDGGNFYADSSTIAIVDSEIGYNRSPRGAGMYLSRTHFTLENSHVHHNTATTDEGGGMNVSNRSVITVTGSTIAHNSAVNGDGGGGLYVANATTHLRNSTVSHNQATSGGGLYVQGSTVHLRNSTVSHNWAASGGGFYAAATNFGTANRSAIISLTHSSLVSNTATVNSGGLYLADSTNGNAYITQANLQNSLIADNSSGNCANLNGWEVVDASAGYNLDSDGTCVTDGVDNNITADPLLLPLTDNGGKTATHALPPGSPALDAIPGGSCGTLTDQRGIARPQGGSCDIGAYELWRLGITAVSMTDASLSWATANNGCTYDLYESTTPYFTPSGMAAYPGVTSAKVVGRLGTVGTNYFFVNRATCNGMTAYSNEVGEFDFTISPGG